jgi:hypothetical protein
MEVIDVPNQEILCTVDACYYNEGGSQCKAEKIMVQNNPGTLGNTKMEVGELGGEAKKSNQTLCHTFIPKERGPKSGIDRLS